MPIFSSTKPPPMMKQTSTPNEASTAMRATRSRVGASNPCVTPRNIGSAEIGLTTMNSVTNSLRRSCHIVPEPRIGPRAEQFPPRRNGGQGQSDRGLAAVKIIRQPQRHAGPNVHDDHAYDDDDHVGHHAGENLVQRDVRR